MLPHPLTNFEIQKHYQNEPKFNDVYSNNNSPKIKDWVYVYSNNNSPKIKDWVYVINLDKFKSTGTHWRALYVNGNRITLKIWLNKT